MTAFMRVFLTPHKKRTCSEHPTDAGLDASSLKVSENAKFYVGHEPEAEKCHRIPAKTFRQACILEKTRYVRRDEDTTNTTRRCHLWRFFFFYSLHLMQHGTPHRIH